MIETHPNLPHVGKYFNKIFADHKRIVCNLSIKIIPLFTSLDPTINSSRSILTINNCSILKF